MVSLAALRAESTRDHHIVTHNDGNSGRHGEYSSQHSGYLSPEILKYRVRIRTDLRFNGVCRKTGKLLDVQKYLKV